MLCPLVTVQILLISITTEPRKNYHLPSHLQVMLLKGHQDTPWESLPGFDKESGATWFYAINYPLRTYQFSIVKNSLFPKHLCDIAAC